MHITKSYTLLLVVVFFFSTINIRGNSFISKNEKTQIHQIDSIHKQLELKIIELETSIKEHKIKEAFFSDMIGTNVSWFAVIIGLIGILFGAFGWKKYNNVENELRSTEINIKTEFNKIIDKQDVLFLEKILLLEQEAIYSRNLISNTNMMFALSNIVDNTLKIKFIIQVLIHSNYEKSFFDKLNLETQNTLLSNYEYSMISKKIEKLKELISQSIDIKKNDIVYELFDNLQYSDKIENSNLIAKELREVKVLLETKINNTI